MARDHTASPSRPAADDPVPRWVVVLFGVTAVAITVTLALGSTVCATDASASCPNWPGCYHGRLTPRAATQPVVEFVHRVISASVGVLALASVVAGARLRHRNRLLLVLPVVALLGALASGIFGMMTIRWGINRVEAAFDLLAAIISMGAMWRAWTTARHPGARWVFRRDVVVGLVAVAGLVASHFGAVLVAGTGSLTRCMGWVMLVRGPGDGPWWGWAAQQAVGLVGALAAIAATATWWRRHRDTATVCLAVLIVVEVVVGIVIAVHGATHLTGTLHAAPASIILALLMASTMRSAQRV